jgi:hypothetical protein
MPDVVDQSFVSNPPQNRQRGHKGESQNPRIQEYWIVPVPIMRDVDRCHECRNQDDASLSEVAYSYDLGFS